MEEDRPGEFDFPDFDEPDPHSEGAAARDRGTPLSFCPYTADEDMAAAWQDGWRGADELECGGRLPEPGSSFAPLLTYSHTEFTHPTRRRGPRVRLTILRSWDGRYDATVADRDGSRAETLTHLSAEDAAHVGAQRAARRIDDLLRDAEAPVL